MTTASSATGIYRRGDPPWGASTRYVQMSTGSGIFYDRNTGNVVNETPLGSGTFKPLKNQATAKVTYETDIRGIVAAGPVGTPPASPTAAAAALAGPAGAPPDPAGPNVTIISKASVTAGAGTALRYPSERAITPDSDYVVFEFFAYEPPFGVAAGSSGGSAVTTSGVAGYINYQGNRGDKTFDPIILYMPEDIQTQFSARWGGMGTGAMGSGIANLMGSAGGADLSELANKITTGLNTIPGMLKTATFKAAVDLINTGLGSSITENQLLGGVTGTVINPNVEMMFEAPDLRNFSLTFKMSPHSQNEAIQIRKICRRFRKAMLPAFGGKAIFGAVEVPNLLTIPSLCQVTFMKGDSPHPTLPHYKQCAIVNVDVNYTPDGSYATFGDADASPVATTLQVSFKETKVIFSDEINEDGASY